MMETVRYGIIGCGMMGQEHIRNIQLLPGADVGAIFEPDAGMAGEAARLCPSAQMVDSLDALLAVQDIQCLLIVSPNFMHANQVMHIAATRPLPLLVEKPLFTDPKDGARLMAMTADYPAPIWVAMEYRYMPPIQVLLERAKDVTGGIEMLTIREHRFPFLEKVNDWNRFNRYSGGTFVEKCCHFFDLMRLAMDDEPVRIMASAGQAANHLEERYEGKVPDILDHGYVIVEFARGGKAMLELCMFAEGSEYQEEISAVGKSGKIEALVPGPGRFWPQDLGAPPEPIVIESPRAPKGPKRSKIPVPEQLLEAGDHNGSTFYQHQQFLDLVRADRAQPEVSLKDGWMAVAMGLAAQDSAATGKAIEFEAYLQILMREKPGTIQSAGIAKE
ncbi:MAG: Gfo/Idh/MocA family protein [Paracoccaceae bacterium]